MEKKQLDFNQPLLSVRRFSSTASPREAEIRRKTDNNISKIPPLPAYKSELKSGPVRHPGTVPFVWERSPGRPKDESIPPTQAPERHPIAPKLPPGRILNSRRQASDKGTKGRPDDQFQTINGLSSSQNETKEVISKEEMKETSSSASEGGDEAYVDALDTLSRSESFFLNCSISGVNGLDGSDLKHSGAFLTDPHSRDFMMGRFLPAAKAMASETPQYSTRKQPVVKELPRQISKASTVERRPLNRYRPNNIPNYALAEGVEDSEDGDHDYYRPVDSSFKLCGLLPQQCLQNSLCLLNPVPGMRKQVRLPVSSTWTTKFRSSNAASHNRTGHEHDRNAIYKQSELKKIASKTEHKKLDESSLFKGFQGGGASRDKIQFSQSFHAPRCIEVPDGHSVASGFIQCGKGGGNFRELLANESKEWESVSESSVVEKTLYTDSVNMVKPRNSNSSSSDLKGLSDYSKNSAEIPVKDREIGETDSVDSSLWRFKQSSSMDEKAKLQPDSLESFDSCFLSLSDKSIHSIHEMQMNVMDGSRQDEDIMQVAITSSSPKVDKDRKFDVEIRWNKRSGMETPRGFIQDSIILASGEVGADGQIDLESQLSRKLSDEESSVGWYKQLPPPPPLPKSPSESWLTRTLPIVSSKNTSSRSSLGIHLPSRVQASKTHCDPTWETIVRTSSVQHGHLRFSEELLTPIPET